MLKIADSKHKFGRPANSFATFVPYTAEVYVAFFCKYSFYRVLLNTIARLGRMDRRNKRRLKLFPKQGYIMLLIGILLGFMIFLAVAAITSQGSGGGAGQEGLPSSISFTFLYTSEKQGWLEEVTPAFEDWFFARFPIIHS